MRGNGLDPLAARRPYGIAQSLGHGHPYNLGAYKNQIIWGLNYIRQRYGSPAAAWSHEQAFNWYGRGGQFAAGQLIGVGDRGPELIRFAQPGQVYSPEQSAGMMSGASGGCSCGGDVHVYVDLGGQATEPAW